MLITCYNDECEHCAYICCKIEDNINCKDRIGIIPWRD